MNKLKFILQYSFPLLILLGILFSNLFINMDFFSNWFESDTIQTKVKSIHHIGEDNREILNIEKQDEFDIVNQNNCPKSLILKINESNWVQAIDEAKSLDASDEKNILLGFLYSKINDFENAEKNLSKSAINGNISAIFNLAVLNQKENREVEAIKNYKSILVLDSNYVLASYNLGVIYLKNKEYTLAEKFFEQALNKNKAASSYKARYNLALVYQKKNEYENAIPIYKSVLKLKPDHLNSRYNLGIIYSEMTKYEKAGGFLKSIIKLDSTFDKAWYSLSNIYEKKGEIDSAIISLNKIDENSELYSNAMYRKLTLLKKNKKYKAVSSILKDLFKKYPEYRFALLNIQNKIELGLNVKGDFDNLVKDFDSYDKSWFEYASYSFKNKEYKKALTLYLNAIEVNPEYKEAWYNLGLTQFKLKQYEKADFSFDKVITIDSTHYESIYNKALIKLKEGDESMSIKWFKMVLAIKPSHYSSLYNIALAEARRGQYLTALEYYNKALLVDDNAEVYFNIARVYSRSDKLDKALEWYEKSIAKNEINPEAYLNKGVIYLKKEDYSNARNSLSLALKYDSTNAQIWYNYGILNSHDDKIDEVRMSYENALKYDENHENSRLNLIILEMKSSNIDQVLKHFDWFSLHNPSEKYLGLWGRYLYREKKYVESIRAFEKIIDNNVGDGESRYWIAKNYFKLLKPNLALVEIKKAQKMFNKFEDEYKVAELLFENNLVDELKVSIGEIMLFDLSLNQIIDLCKLLSFSKDGALTEKLFNKVQKLKSYKGLNLKDKQNIDSLFIKLYVELAVQNNENSEKNKALGWIKKAKALGFKPETKDLRLMGLL